VAGKPPAAVQKIVEGKLDKYYSQVCLLEQPFVKNPEKAIKDLLTEKVAKLGENIQVRRFVRYQLGA
jgi:elongation factor Ts